jgi:Ferritin-like domain
MTDHWQPTLEDVDRDGALTEAVADLCGETRATFLKTAALGGAAMLAALATPREAVAQISDVGILNFGLRFERMQATFYTQADEMGTIGKMVARKQLWARTLGAHERAHVRILKKVLGPKAERSPTFDFGKANETDANFTRTAVAMEDLTVALLGGLTPIVHNRQLNAAFFSLLTVEARHAAWARHLVGAHPVPVAFDKPRTLDSVAGTVARTHFISNRPKVSSRRSRPRFTG